MSQCACKKSDSCHLRDTGFYIQSGDETDSSAAASRSPSEFVSRALQITKSNCFHSDLNRGSSGRSNLQISSCVQEQAIWRSLGLPDRMAEAGSTIWPLSVSEHLRQFSR